MNNENLSEKVSVNINSSTLSSIDLLVDNGYYSNRSDFINQALRSTLQQHQSTLERIIEQNTASKDNGNVWFVGVYAMSAKDIDSLYDSKTKKSIKGYGVLILEDGIDAEKLYSAVESIQIRGKVVCRKEIKEHYGAKSK